MGASASAWTATWWCRRASRGPWPVPWACARPSARAASRSSRSRSIGAWWSRPWVSMRECRLWAVCSTPEQATRRGHVEGRRQAPAGRKRRDRLLAAGRCVASAGEVAEELRRVQRGRPDWSSSRRRGTSGGEGRAGIGVRPGPAAPRGPAAEHPVDSRPSAGRLARRFRPSGGRDAPVSAGAPPPGPVRAPRRRRGAPRQAGGAGTRMRSPGRQPGDGALRSRRRSFAAVPPRTPSSAAGSRPQSSRYVR